MNNMDLNSTPNQIKGFLALVDAVNEIPHVHIDLKSPDLQADALAFVVDTVYRQFKDNDWQLAIEQLPVKIREWNTPKNSLQATSSLLSFIQHLFDYRIAELKNEPIPDSTKKGMEALRSLYQASTSSILTKAQREQKDEPVNIGGIPRSLLPTWYLNREYLS